MNAILSENGFLRNVPQQKMTESYQIEIVEIIKGALIEGIQSYGITNDNRWAIFWTNQVNNKTSLLFSEMNLSYPLGILFRKHQDYGPGPIHYTGFLGLAVRMLDKVGRYENLINSEQNVNFEPIDDTILDLFNYGLLGCFYGLEFLDGEHN